MTDSANYLLLCFGTLFAVLSPLATVPAFKIAGGLVLLLASLEMLRGNRASRVSKEEGAEKEDISITPLGIPLLCGPVTIATGILLSSRAITSLHFPILIGVVLVIYGITYGDTSFGD